MKGNGKEAGQTSKAQTKMPRFRLEGPWPCKIFCFALIHCARATQPTRFCWLDPQCGVNNYFVLCTVKAKKSEQKPTTKDFVGFHSHAPLLPMVGLC